MKFKRPSLMKEFTDAPEKLREIAFDFQQLSLDYFGIEPTITRILERIKASSGVHSAGRAIDFRDQHEGLWLYDQDQSEALCTLINSRYPRNDGKLVLMNHSFNGGPSHFHMQIPHHWA